MSVIPHAENSCLKLWVSLFALAWVPAWADAPGRVVSINPCTDQLAMLVAEEGQLVSISRIAAEPESSAMADEAQGYHLNSGGAEEIFLLEPDLVLAGEYSDPHTLSILDRLGVPYERFPNIVELAEIPTQLRAMGAALGQEARADILALLAETRLARFDTGEDGPVAAFFYPNGFTLGAGSLGADIIRAAGYTNLSERIGLPFGGRLALETLVMEQPDVLISSSRYDGASEAEAILSHPALAPYRDKDRVLLSGPEWVCGTPFTLDAVEAMASQRARFLPD